MPIASNPCALEKAQTLWGFSLFGPSFLSWPEKGWKEGAKKGTASCCAFPLLRMPRPGAGCSAAPRVSGRVAERASKGDGGGERHSPHQHEEWLDVEGGGRGLSKTHSGAIEPGFTHGPRSLPRAGSPLLLLPVSLRLGAAPPRAGRKRGLLCTLRAPGQQLWRGPPAHPGHRSSVAAFSSNRKTIPRTGPSSCLQTLASPEAPRAAFVTTPA